MLDRLGKEIRPRHYSSRIEDACAAWAERFILFHGKRHPKEMRAEEFTKFLS